MAILLAGVLAVYIILELCKKVDARDRATYSAASAQKSRYNKTENKRRNLSCTLNKAFVNIQILLHKKAWKTKLFSMPVMFLCILFE